MNDDKFLEWLILEKIRANDEWRRFDSKNPDPEMQRKFARVSSRLVTLNRVYEQYQKISRD